MTKDIIFLPDLERTNVSKKGREKSGRVEEWKSSTREWESNTREWKSKCIASERKQEGYRTRRISKDR